MSFFWDPSPIAFEVPFIHVSVHWYGLFFAIGLLTSAIVCTHLFKKYIFLSVSKENISSLIDSLFLYGCIGLLLGARLFHVFFYDWDYYKNVPSHIVSIWEGGLASHGGAIGLLFGTWLFYKKHKIHETFQLPIVRIFDTMALSAYPAAVAIRLGNFFNQEIIGTPTSCWTGVLFGHPLDITNIALPRHPVQLYEALAYLLLGILFSCKIRSILSKPGLGLGLILTSFFSVRFLLEFLKAPQTASDIQSTLSTGQELSIPLIIIGIILIVWQRRRPNNGEL